MTDLQRAELTKQVVQVCNCTVEKAQKLLSYCNWDLLTAINLHFTGFDPNVIPQTNNQQSVTIVQSLNHDLYINFQEEAKKMNKWAIVFIKISNKDISIFNRFSMYDFIGTRFHCLSLDPDDSCTKWFIDYFNISTSPSLAIINPTTGQLIDKLCSDLNSSRVTNFLNDFLSSHRDFGNSFDFDLNCTDPPIISDKTQQISQENKEKIEKNEKEKSETFSIAVETFNKKRTLISIGENDSIESLYKKVGSLLKLQSSKFLLLKYPNKEIRGMTSSVKDYKLNGALVRVSTNY